MIMALNGIYRQDKGLKDKLESAFRRSSL